MRQTKKSRSPHILPVLLVLLGVIGLGYLGFRLLFRPQSIGINQITGGTGSTILALTPASSSVNPNIPASLTLNIDTGEEVAAVQVELTYPVANCLPPTVTQGSFLSNVISPATITNGVIKFAYSIPSTATSGVQGTGVLAIITTGPTTGPCRLTFTANTIVATLNDPDANDIASAYDAVINPIIVSSPSPSPSLFPSSLPSLAPSPSPSPTAVTCPDTYSAYQCQQYLASLQQVATTKQNRHTCLTTSTRPKVIRDLWCNSSLFIKCTSKKPLLQCL